MNRIFGLILALFIGVAVSSCASAAKSSGSSAEAGSRATASASSDTGRGPGARRTRRSRRPTENRHTREAARNIGLAILRPEDQQAPLFQEALRHAQAAIESEPENARGWFLAGQAHAKLKDYEAADSSFTRAESLYRGYREDIKTEREEAWIIAYNTAIETFNNGDIPATVKHLENADKIYRGRPEALYLLGSFYANQNEYDKAITAYEALLAILRDTSLQPSEAEAKEQWSQQEEETVLNMGTLYFILDRIPEAEKVYREYLERNPNHLDMEVNLALALTRQEKTAEAAEVFERIAARPELTASQLLTVGIGLFNAENFAGAADAFTKAIEKNPHLRDAHLNYAKAVLRMSLVLEEAKVQNRPDQDDAKLIEHYRAMIESGQKVLELDPFNAEIYTYMLRSHQGLSQLLPQARDRQRHENELRALVRKFEALPVEVDHLAIQQDEGRATVGGVIKNRKMKQGDPITIRITLLSATGEAIGSADVTKNMPAPESATEFEVTIQYQGEFEGWKYERVQ